MHCDYWLLLVVQYLFNVLELGDGGSGNSGDIAVK
jgi:hypothetical protein